MMEVDHGEATHIFPPQFARHRNLIIVSGRFPQTPFLELWVNLYNATNLFFFFFPLREWGKGQVYMAFSIIYLLCKPITNYYRHW